MLRISLQRQKLPKAKIRPSFENLPFNFTHKMLPESSILDFSLSLKREAQHISF
jgi:hypothetical protein